MLFFNGPILTMDESNTVAEAVLTRGERIVAVGEEKTLRAQLSGDAELVDLQSRTMIPAFIDPHGHFPDPGIIALFRVDLAAPPRGDCPDMATALGRLGEKAAATPAGEWVMGVLFDNTAIAERRMPTREELDSVSRDHPVWVLHASGHNGVANSMALSRLGVDDTTPDPPGGRYGRENGGLTGLVEGIAAMGEAGDTDFLIDRDRFWQAFAATRDEYLGQGVTFAQNAWAAPSLLRHFASLPAGRDPGIDILVLPVGELEPALSRGPDALDWPDNRHITLGPRKLFADGAFQLQTAWLSAPYHRPLKPDAPCGGPYTSPEAMNAQVRKLHDLGFQIHCHCNGDAGAQMFLDAVERAQENSPRADHRHTIIHGQVLRDDQLERMARLGVTVSFFSAHIHFWGERHFDTFLGPERAARISPAASAEKFGVRYTIHNDASVTPTRPLHLAHCAVNRCTSSGRILGEEERISALSALRAQTIDAAWQVFREHERGSLEPGKIAELTVLSDNPLDRPDAIESIRVSSVVRRGRAVFTE